jgi:exopolysaccharide biosynthesis polyprenyl glycosylphosphotransferase
VSIATQQGQHVAGNDGMPVLTTQYLPPVGEPAAIPAARPKGADPKRVMARYRHRAILVDFLCAALASALALVLRFRAEVFLDLYVLGVAVPFAWVAILGLQRAYEYRFLGNGAEENRRVLNSAVLLFTGIALLSYVSSGEFSRVYVGLLVPFTGLLTLAARYQLRGWLYRLRENGVGLQKVIVVGRADAATHVIDKLDKEPQLGLVAVGACVPDLGAPIPHVHGVPVIGDPDHVLEAVEEVGADVVAVVSHPDLAGQALQRLSWALEERGVELVVSPGIVEVAGPRLSIRPVAGLSLLHLEPPAASGGKMLAKAAFDRVLGTVILLLIGPLLVVLAAGVKLTSPGPVLFRQKRIGVHGQEFTMLKFRSMVVDAEARLAELKHLSEGNGVLFKMKNDPRITRIGGILRRYSLDELPQLINVVRGDMSLVGPRPPLPQEVAGYTADAIRRLRVRPGLTGLWQVSGRSDLSWEESLRLDLRYVDNWSMALDLTILWRTWRAIVGGSGAY